MVEVFRMSGNGSRGSGQGQVNSPGQAQNPIKRPASGACHER